MRISDWSSDVCSSDLTLTMNTQLLHLDAEFAKEHSVSGTRLVNSTFTLGLVVGVGVSDVSNGTIVGNLGFKDISSPAPVVTVASLLSTIEVLSARESNSRPDRGIVRFRHRRHDQKGTSTLSYQPT